jgi:hypothetical protein
MQVAHNFAPRNSGTIAWTAVVGSPLGFWLLWQGQRHPTMTPTWKAGPFIQSRRLISTLGCRRTLHSSVRKGAVRYRGQRIYGPSSEVALLFQDYGRALDDTVA